MEQLSLAYARAVGALANCSVEETRVDRDSVDVTFCIRGSQGGYLTSPMVAAQMKAYACALPSNTHLAYDIKTKNYNDLIQTSSVPRILVVLCIPKAKSDWASCTADSLVLRRRALWHNMRGLSPTTNKAKERVHLSMAQVFDPPALRLLLQKVSRQEELTP